MRGVDHVEHDVEEDGQGRYEVEFVANSEDDCDAGERGRKRERDGERERERLLLIFSFKKMQFKEDTSRVVQRRS